MQTAALHSIAGFFALHLLAWLVSEHRRAVGWRSVAAGMALTLALGVVLLKLPPVSEVFLNLNSVVAALERATQDGTSFVFGYLGGGPLPFGREQTRRTLLCLRTAFVLRTWASCCAPGLWEGPWKWG